MEEGKSVLLAWCGLFNNLHSPSNTTEKSSSADSERSALRKAFAVFASGFASFTESKTCAATFV